LKSGPQERRDESRRGRHECPRHENQVVAGTHTKVIEKIDGADERT
jgi:hypothetical protein